MNYPSEFTQPAAIERDCSRAAARYAADPQNPILRTQYLDLVSLLWALDNRPQEVLWAAAPAR